MYIHIYIHIYMCVCIYVCVHLRRSPTFTVCFFLISTQVGRITEPDSANLQRLELCHGCGTSSLAQEICCPIYFFLVRRLQQLPSRMLEQLDTYK